MRPFAVWWINDTDSKTQVLMVFSDCLMLKLSLDKCRRTVLFPFWGIGRTWREEVFFRLQKGSFNLWKEKQDTFQFASWRWEPIVHLWACCLQESQWHVQRKLHDQNYEKQTWPIVICKHECRYPVREKVRQTNEDPGLKTLQSPAESALGRQGIIFPFEFTGQSRCEENPPPKQKR